MTNLKKQIEDKIKQAETELDEASCRCIEEGIEGRIDGYREILGLIKVNNLK